jgi:hypothetical protein
MDTDTKILLILLIAAFFWWFKLALDEDKNAARDFERREKERLSRQERIKQLFNRQ